MPRTTATLALQRAAFAVALASAATLGACADEESTILDDAGTTDGGTTDTGGGDGDAGMTDTGGAEDTGGGSDAGMTDTGGAEDAGGAEDTGGDAMIDAGGEDVGTDATMDVGSEDVGTDAMMDVGGEDVGGEDVGGEAASWDEVNDIFFAECAACHYGMPAGLGFADAYADIVNVESTQAPGMMRVAPGDLDGSYLWLKVTGMHGLVGSGTQMPQDGPLSDDDLATLRSWILGGAQP